VLVGGHVELAGGCSSLPSYERRMKGCPHVAQLVEQGWFDAAGISGDDAELAGVGSRPYWKKRCFSMNSWVIKIVDEMTSL